MPLVATTGLPFGSVMGAVVAAAGALHVVSGLRCVARRASHVEHGNVAHAFCRLRPAALRCLCGAGAVSPCQNDIADISALALCTRSWSTLAARLPWPRRRDRHHDLLRGRCVRSSRDPRALARCEDGRVHPPATQAARCSNLLVDSRIMRARRGLRLIVAEGGGPRQLVLPLLFRQDRREALWFPGWVSECYASERGARCVKPSS